MLLSFLIRFWYRNSLPQPQQGTRNVGEPTSSNLLERFGPDVGIYRLQLPFQGNTEVRIFEILRYDFIIDFQTGKGLPSEHDRQNLFIAV